MSSNEEANLLPVFTLVLWLTCLAVGIMGLLLPYPRPRPQPPILAPVRAQRINVEIADDPSPQQPPEVAPFPAPPSLPAQSPAPQLVMLNSTPLIPVESPKPTTALAKPLQAPVRTTPPTAPPASAAQHLIYGQGEGRQPAPEYPREAVLVRQQGIVTVRFIVDQDGRILSAQAITPCPWPLLNQSAIRAIRETWRFLPGPVRSYEVSIQFQLRQQ